MIDLQRDLSGTPLAPYNGDSPEQSAFLRDLKSLGLYTFMRWGSFMCTPPHSISEEELSSAFALIDEALTRLDQKLGF